MLFELGWSAMAADAVAALATGWLYDRFGAQVLVVLPLPSAAVPALAFTDTVGVAVAGVLVWGAAVGVQESTPRATVADLVAPGGRATAYGVFAGIMGGAALRWRAASWPECCTTSPPPSDRGRRRHPGRRAGAAVCHPGRTVHARPLTGERAGTHRRSRHHAAARPGMERRTPSKAVAARHGDGLLEESVSAREHPAAEPVLGVADSGQGEEVAAAGG
ncbi:hypothetical protein ACE1SV_75890 [Streptomyces sennicomposti]